MYQRILVPVDGGDTAHQALQEAIKLAQSLSAHLRLLYVVDELSFIDPESYIDIAALRDIHRQTGERVLAAGAAMVRQAGVAVETQLLETLTDSVENSIDAEAQHWQADLMVLGTHGRSGFSRLLFGSVAENVVRHSPVPVLLVRDHPKASSATPPPIAN